MELVIGQDKTDGQADFEEVMISCGYLAQVCVNLFFSVGVMGEQSLFVNTVFSKSKRVVYKRLLVHKDCQQI